MNGKDAELENLELSHELLQAISADIAMVEVDLPVLSGSDLAALKRILRGEIIPKIRIDRKRAVNALARSERSVEAGEILARILSDSEELSAVRVVAALNLSIMPSEVAESALLQNLTSDDEMLRSAIFKSLGCFGTANGLANLDSLPIQENEHTQRLLSFAKLSINFRSGLQGQDVQDVIDTMGIRWTIHAAKAVQGEQVQEYINALLGSTYGITLNPNIAFEFSCGRMKHFFFLNDAVRQGGYITSIYSRPMIAGLVALKEARIIHLAIRYLILTIPGETGIDVITTRLNGDVAYLGQAHLDGDELRLRMRDVATERIPTEIEGVLSNTAINFYLRIWRGTTRPKKHGEPIRV